MRFKRGVSLRGAQWQTWHAAVIADHVMIEEGHGELVITSVTEGEHKHATHGLGYAFDARNRHIPKHQRQNVRNRIAARLGPGFDVVEEFDPDHYHIEFDPRVLEIHGGVS